MSNISRQNGPSSKVAELVTLIQSRRKSAPPIFIDGEQIKDISELGSLVAAVGEDAAHGLQGMLAINPFERFEKLELVREIKDEDSGMNLTSALEFILKEKDIDTPIKIKAIEVTNLCLKAGIETERSLTLLLALLRDIDSDVASNVIEELKSTIQSRKLPEDSFRRIAVALFQVYNEHSGELGSENVKAGAVSAFGGLKHNLERTGLLDEALTFLEKAIQEQSDLLKAMAANSLSLIPTERSKEILGRALEKAKPGNEKDYIEYRYKRVSLSLAKGLDED